jgi:putative DNA primase/helicase
MNFPADVIPPELRALPQWVGWKFRDKSNGKKSKVPIRIRDKHPAAVNNPKDWTTFEYALERLGKSSAFSGIGFVFTEADDLCGIDLDNCLDSETGELSPFAQELVERINSYTEVSPSGKGIKIFFRNSKPQATKRTPKIECYCERHFFTVTGRVFQNYTLIHDRTEEFNALWTERFGPDATSQSSSCSAEAENWSQFLSTLNVPDDDDVILNTAMKARNGGKLIRLWRGIKTDHSGDHSRCDGSLCSILAYWCGPDPIRVDRLFRKSALMRPKWDEKHSTNGQTYGEWQVRHSLLFQQSGGGFYQWQSGFKLPMQKAPLASAPKQPKQSPKPNRTKNLSMNIDAEVFFHAKAQSMKQQMKWRDFIQNLLANC